MHDIAIKYDCLEEFLMELALYPNKKQEIFRETCCKMDIGWFTVFKDGNCALFNNRYELDDINKIKQLTAGMVSKSVEKLNVPDSVTELLPYALNKCLQLTELKLPVNLHAIRTLALSDTALRSIIVPEGTISIYSHAFADNCALKQVMLPKSIRWISYTAFNNHGLKLHVFFKGKSLEEIKSLDNYPWGLKDDEIIADK